MATWSEESICDEMAFSRCQYSVSAVIYMLESKLPGTRMGAASVGSQPQSRMYEPVAKQFANLISVQWACFCVGSYLTRPK